MSPAPFRRRVIPDTALAESFDGLTLIAARLCEAPFALITFVDAGRRWLESRLGATVAGTSPETPFDAHAVRRGDLFVVRDALADGRFAAHPSVASDPRIRFYAGVPLITSQGEALGTLCVVDQVPRDLGPGQREALRALARQAVALLELSPNATALSRPGGEPCGGVDGRGRAEEELRQSEEWLAAIFETSRDGILVEDGKNILRVNEAYARIFGYESPEELIGKPVSAVLSGEDEERLLEFGRRRLRGEPAPTVYEFRGKRKDGTPVELEASVSTPAVEGKTYITTAVRDLSERRRAEQALRESESKYRTLVEQASDGIHTYDFAGNFLEVNSKLCEMLGYTRDELARLKVKDFIPAEDLAAAPLRFGELREGKTVVSERRVRRKDGTLLPVEISGKMLPSGELQAIIRDVTERKRAEEALRRAHDELERRVEERTAELAAANEALGAEVAEHKRAEEARRELLRRLVTSQEDERRRIARELHDRTGQHLTALLLELQALKDAAQLRPTDLDRVQRLQALVKQLGRDVHHLAWELRPTALDDFGLHTALLNYAEEWSRWCKIEVAFHSVGLDRQRLAPEVETTLYRVVQEALNNVLRHARARRVSVILERRQDHVLAIVEDDGRGFDAGLAAGAHATVTRLGLLGMQERVALVKGALNIESAPGAGTTLFVRVPAPPLKEGVRADG